MNYPDTCPLCGAPRVALGLYACIEREDACDPGEIDVRTRTSTENAERRRRFLASLPELYREYAERPLPAEVVSLNPEAMEKLARMSASGFLYVTGEADSAKTHLAVRQALRFVTEGKSALFVEETAYFQALFREFRGGPPAPDLIAPEVLVYDDLGKQKPSEFALEKLYHLLSARLAHRRATIVTSNLTPLDAVARLTDDSAMAGAIYSRLIAGQLAGIRRGQGGRKGSAV